MESFYENKSPRLYIYINDFYGAYTNDRRGSAFQHGPQTYHARSAVHISIDKAFFNKKLNITLALHDVLYKDYFSVTNKYENQSSYWYDRMDTRRFRLRISYRFGKMQIQQRIQNEGGGVNTGK